MTDPLHTELLELAQEAARRAGTLLRDGRPADLEVAATKSSPIDVVTEMDIAAEKLITGYLAGLRPDDGFLGEEGASSEGTSGIRWVIDPLDGTVNYLYGLPTWSVSIAAEQDGETVVGVVAAPMRGETFHAVRGGGAYLGDRRLRCRPAPPLDQALVSTGFNYVTTVRVHQASVAQQLIPQLAGHPAGRLGRGRPVRRRRGPARRVLRTRTAPLGPRGRGPHRPRGRCEDRWAARGAPDGRSDGRRVAGRLRAPPGPPGGVRRLARLTPRLRAR